MASVTLLTSGGTTAENTSFASASISVSAGKLVLVHTVSMGVDTSDRGVPVSVSGAGLTFEKVAESLFDSFVAQAVWRAMPTSSGSGAITMSHALNQDIVQWRVFEVDGVLTTGTNGADAVGTPSVVAANSNTLTATPSFSAGGPAIAFNAFGDPNTATTASVTPGAGFTELSDFPTIDASWMIAGQTQLSATSDTTADVTWSRSGNISAIAFELVPSEAPGANASGPLAPVALTPAEAAATAGGAATGTMAALSLTPALAGAASEAAEPVAIGWIRRHPASGMAVWYSPPGQQILEGYYFGASTEGAVSVSGLLASVGLAPAQAAATGAAVVTGALQAFALTAAEVSASGGAAGSVALAPVTLTPAEAGATSGAAASGALSAVSLTAAEASASGAAAVSAALAHVSLTAAVAGVTAGASASGAMVAVSLAAAQASAAGGAATSAALPPLALSPAEAAATGAASVTAPLSPVTLTPAQASAASAGPGAATGAMAQVNLSAAQASAIGGAAASGAVAPISLAPAQAAAGLGASVSAALAFVSIAPAQAFATGGAVAAGPMVGINLSPAESVAAGGAWLQSELAQITLAAALADATEGYVPEYTSLPFGGGGTRLQGGVTRPAHAYAARPAHAQRFTRQ